MSVEDVSELVEIGLQIFHSSENKLYAQVRKLIPEKTPATFPFPHTPLIFPLYYAYLLSDWFWYNRLDGLMF